MHDNTAESVENALRSPEKVVCRPFLKWVGGKSQLLPELGKRAPKKFRRYYEPFVGAGAFLFNLQPKQAFILDVNNDLINAYNVVKTDVESLIEDLRQHFYEKDYFYKIRDVDRLDDYKKWSPIARASRLIFLNKTCFNGLYRVNSKGQFNTPFGRYTNPTILDGDNLRACSKALQNVSIQIADFRDFESNATNEDFVYFDPPYVPLSTTAYFTSYSERGFDSKMQIELFELCKRLDKKNIKFMLSNSSATYVLELYKDFKIEIVAANRAINSNGTRRGPVNEVIVTNY